MFKHGSNQRMVGVFSLPFSSYELSLFPEDLPPVIPQLNYLPYTFSIVHPEVTFSGAYSSHFYYAYTFYFFFHTRRNYLALKRSEEIPQNSLITNCGQFRAAEGYQRSYS